MSTLSAVWCLLVWASHPSAPCGFLARSSDHDLLWLWYRFFPPLSLISVFISSVRVTRCAIFSFLLVWKYQYERHRYYGTGTGQYLASIMVQCIYNYTLCSTAGRRHDRRTVPCIVTSQSRRNCWAPTCPVSSQWKMHAPTYRRDLVRYSYVAMHAVHHRGGISLQS